VLGEQHRPSATKALSENSIENPIDVRGVLN